MPGGAKAAYARTRCDTRRWVEFNYNGLSTHTPARDATKHYDGRMENIRAFNPYARTRCDVAVVL